jgi:glycolate oxidase
MLYTPEDTTPYECDGLTAYRERPLVVALPETDEQVQAVLKTCHGLDVPVVARGAGTGLSGGAMPHAMGVTLSLAKFNRILKVDPVSRTAVVQGGVRNLAISEAAAPHGLYYAPDPSSQIACTIGGNVAENAGGVHCLKYGLTVHNVLKVKGFTIEGERWSSAARRWMRPATTCWPWSSAARACWPSRPKSRSSWCPSRCWRAASWPASTTSARPATPWRR